MSSSDGAAPVARAVTIVPETSFSLSDINNLDLVAKSTLKLTNTYTYTADTQLTARATEGSRVSMEMGYILIFRMPELKIPSLFPPTSSS